MPNLIIGSVLPLEPLPLRGFPEGRARYRYREDEAPQVFIRTTTGIRWFVVALSEDQKAFVPALEIGRNQTL